MIGVEVRYRKMREKIETYQQLVSLATLLGKMFSIYFPLGANGGSSLDFIGSIGLGGLLI